MKVTLLGTNGFLSSAIGRYFSKKGYNLYTYGISAPKDHQYYTFRRLDFTKEELNYIEVVDSDIIIYCIGAGIQSNLQEGNELIYNLNVSCPVKICNSLRKFGYKGIFLSFGSYFEMGKTELRRPFTEDDLLFSTSEALNDYTVSKRMLSRFVSCYQTTFTHWHFYLPTIYGKGENPQRLIPYTINALQNNDELHFTEGSQIREYIHVDEVPRIIEKSISNHLPNGLYNIQGNQVLTVREIISIIHKHYKKEVKDTCFGKTQRADKGMSYLTLDGSKIKTFIGDIEYVHTIENTIETY